MCKMSFTVMANNHFPDYFVVGIDKIKRYGVKHNVFGGFFTIGRKKKRKFQFKCTKDTGRILKLNTWMDSLSITSQSEVGVGEQTPEPERFKEALKDALWDEALIPEDKEEVLEVIHQVPMIFSHGRSQIGDITTEMFDIQLTIKDGEDPSRPQKKAYPASPQRKKVFEVNIHKLLALGGVVLVDSKPKDAIVSPFMI